MDGYTMDNKEILLKTALELFTEKGYDAVGVAEIAQKAGIGKPTMYHYFGNKQGLLTAICLQYAEVFYQSTKKAVIYQGDLSRNLSLITINYFTFARQNSSYYRLQLSAATSAPESIVYQTFKPYIRKEYKLLEELFLQAAKDHGNMQGRQQYYAVSFIGLLNTYITLVLNNITEVTDELIHRVVHQFMHGIFS
jgi:TetR/AcrR family transcriptional regulator